MELPIYQIDAFSSDVFKGNPAAVCPLSEWLPDETMQSIAEENNLSETAFFVPMDDNFYIRWFTPVSEVDLCGHATLGSAYVLFNILGYKNETIRFDSKS
ncbi:MAG: PhzF family phenazine biosynthesis protein, partial [Deltaproteobacteria bacterium]|nr:PhzF family phenazine biosynthesis protein [Deltaproteobacteria bacterium]